MMLYESHLSSLRPDAVARKVLLVSAAVTLALYVIPDWPVPRPRSSRFPRWRTRLGPRWSTAELLGGGFRRLAIWLSGAGAH